jgi:hypothetical protein
MLRITIVAAEISVGKSGPMSQLGQFQKSARANAMSAFPPVSDQTADIAGGPVRAKPESRGSFNHLVGEQLKGVGHHEAEGRGGLEINDEFVFERELNWQIARICASQNLVHV